MEAETLQIQPLVERRRNGRLPYTEPIQYRDVFKPQELFAGSLSRDLSAGGLRISSGRFIPKDARLVILLSLPDSLRQIRAICRVVWQRDPSFGDGYEYGLQFVELTPEDRDCIAGFVERGVLVPQSLPPEDALKATLVA